MTAVAVTAPDETIRSKPARRGGFLGRLLSVARFLVGVLLCLTPLTAVLVLGWLMRLMQREEALARQRLQGAAVAHQRARLPRWIVAEPSFPSRGVWRWFGSLVDNLRLGMAALATIAAGTLPFAVLWLFSWWAGWENSFNKGYEQAWVGPTIGLVGVAVALPLLARLPMALAHQAAEGRLSAFFAWRDVRGLVRGAGWRYVALSMLMVLASAPLLLAKTAPVFVDQWRPGQVADDAAAVETLAGYIQLGTAAYLLATLVLLRRAAARLHARATLAAARVAKSGWIRAAAGASARTTVLWLIWFAFVVQIYVGQFFSHQWLAWINHPVVGLPWIAPLGAAL